VRLFSKRSGSAGEAELMERGGGETDSVKEGLKMLISMKM
jgi:hypothetical protein